MNSGVRAWMAVVGAIMAAFMSVMDIQITNVAIHQIQSAMSATLEEGAWVTSSYLIAEISVIPLTRLFVRRFGLDRMIIGCCIAFSVASILCAQAWDLRSMVVFRAMQGAAGGMLMPLAYMCIMSRLDKTEHVKAMSIFGIASSSAPAVGPGVAGVLVESLGWQIVFYAALPIAALASFLIWSASEKVASSSTPAQAPQTTGRTDAVGLVCVVLGVACLVYILEEGNRSDWFSSGTIRALTLLALSTLSIFVWRSLADKNPLIDLRLLSERQFGLACTTSFVGGFALFGCLFLVPYFLTSVHRYDATEISKVILWMAIPQIGISLAIPHIMRRFDYFVVISTGFLLFALSCVMCAYLSHDFAGPQFSLPLLLRAIGLPMIMIAIGIYAMHAVGQKDTASASVLLNISRSIGGAIGVSCVATWIDYKKSAMLQEMLAHVDPAVIGDYGASTGVEFSEATFKHGVLDSMQAVAVARDMDAVTMQATIAAFGDAFQRMSLVLLACGAIFAGMHAHSVIEKRRQQARQAVTG